MSAPAVPFTRLDNADPELMEELLGAVARVARRAAFVGGEEVEAFEAEFAEYCDAGHAVAVASGTDALALALKALEIGPGDEVVVPANSFVATAEAVTLAGATPVLVDPDPDTQLVTAAGIAGAIGPRTRAVIPVHLYGRTLDLEPILTLAREAGLRVIEDACQAHGARLDGRRVGALGDCGAFSFYPAKNLGAWGDAGALVTHDAEIADRVRLLRSHGERPRYHHRVPGTTARMDGIHAAVLRVKLRRLDAANASRRAVAAALTRALDGAGVATPAPLPAGRDHVYHLYVVRCDRRDALREHLARRGVASAVHYPVPIHRSPAYADSPVARGGLPVAESLAASVCSLPMFPGMDAAAVERVASAVVSFSPEPVAA